MSEQDLLEFVQRAVADEIRHDQPRGSGTMEQTGAVSLGVLRTVYDRCRTLYGDAPFDHVLRRVLQEHLIPQQDQLLIESHRVQEATRNFSRLLRDARSGHSQVVGGYQQGSDPVVMMSVEQLVELVGDAMKKRSIADLLPASRPPLNQVLTLTEGAPASPSAVEL